MDRAGYYTFHLAMIQFILGIAVGWYFYTGTHSYTPMELSIVYNFDFNLYLPASANTTMEGVVCDVINNFTYDSRTEWGIGNYTHYACSSITGKRVVLLVESALPVLISRFNYSGLGDGHYLVDQIYPFWQQTYYVTVNLESGSDLYTPVLQLFSQSLGPELINQTQIIMSGGLTRNYVAYSNPATSPFAIVLAILILGLLIANLVVLGIDARRLCSRKYESVSGATQWLRFSARPSVSAGCVSDEVNGDETW